MKRPRKRWLILISAILLGPAVFAIMTLSRPTYEGPVSDHFDGSRFFNPEPGDHSFTDMVKWMWQMETVAWPEWIADPTQPPPSDRVADGHIRVTYINHATVLIQLDSLNILTDPIWSDGAGPISWLSTKRVRAPGVRMDDLPAIDYVLISHDHYDHLDLPTLKDIVQRNHPVVLAGLGVKALLEDEGIDSVIQMDWWQTHRSQTGDVRFTFVPASHDSGRWPFLENTTLWGGFMIERRSGEQVYYAGDTGFGDFLHAIGNKFNQIQLAILPVGSYEKRWFMKYQHMNPDDAVRALQLLNARQGMGVHFATFLEHPEQSIDAHETDLAAALARHHIDPARFWLLGFGEGRDLPEAGRIE